MIWAYAASFFLIAYNSLGFQIIYVYIFVLIFSKIFINVVFFDIKDLKTDKIEGLKTIPLFIGKVNTLKLLNIINIISLVFIILAIYIGIFPTYMISFTVFFLFTFYYLNKSKNADDKKLLKYSYFLADAEFILWPVVLFLSKIIYLRVL
jgi:4-hydroxybenzoate polyprenyltransferase